MEKTFQTGSFSFRLKFSEELVLPVDMEKFLVETDSVDYTYIITDVDILPEAEGELIVDRVDLQVFHTKEGLESRRIGVKGEARPYAFYREIAQNRAEVFVGRWYLAEIEKYEVVFLSLLALERRLAEQPCLILHCAYTEYQGKAMLFSATSGTGKTTQAGLWEQYQGSCTVNGDKALLEYDGTAWTANGWPVCGTSGVCENKKLPVGCIVMLSQAKTIRRGGRGIYESVRTDHHEPLGQGGTGTQSRPSRTACWKSSGVSSGVRHFRRCGENAGAGDRDRFVRK